MSLVREGALAMVSALWVLFLPPNATPVAAATIMGSGVESCGSWLQHRADGGSSDMQWVLGYLSGAAIYNGKNPLVNTDGNGVWYWIDNYCRSHAASKLADALDAFVSERGVSG